MPISSARSRRSAYGYESPREFFEARLAEGIATIAAAFWPKPVIVRMSDFKSNEYKKLIGGSRYEPDEENPMLGIPRRCALHRRKLPRAVPHGCAALKRVRDVMGLTNVEIMVPFVRTLDGGPARDRIARGKRADARRPTGCA